MYITKSLCVIKHQITTLLYSRNQHNIVKQLYFDTIKLKK